MEISIHAPRTGSDTAEDVLAEIIRPFQSTLPARGATFAVAIVPSAARFQSTLPARGATMLTEYSSLYQTFQSTLPARGATDFGAFISMILTFQSTLPARGATARHEATFDARSISIHAPRTGSDTVLVVSHRGGLNFNPRSPHGERLKALREANMNTYFNPRSPHGERQRKVTILSIRIIGFAQKVYHKTVLLRISLAENAVILPEKPRNPVRTSLQKAGGLRFARAIRAARPYSISSPSGA